nr:MAG TPA: hypothetical protein [Caudoviricetes sp.]
MNEFNPFRKFESKILIQDLIYWLLKKERTMNS